MTRGEGTPQVAEMPTEADFVERYGSETLVIKGQETTLNEALKFEAMFCPVPEDERQDPAERVQYLAKLVGPKVLAPEHQGLIPTEEEVKKK